MRLYTLHFREARNMMGDRPRTRLVREGFSFPSFLLGPLPFLFRGLWLAALLALLLPFVAGGLGGLLAAALGTPDAGWAEAGAVLAGQLLLGLHARDLERWTLRRRGYALRGVVAGNDHEDAMLRAVTVKPDVSRGAVA